MDSGYGSPGTGQPLSIGNVISAGLRLYRNHFKQYFGMAFFATLWILLAIAAAIGIALFFVAVQNNYGLLVLLIPAWLVLLLYCSGRYMAGTAAITRLAFGELSNQPETAQQAKRFTQSRQWWYLLTGGLVGLIFLGLFIAFYLALIIFVVAIFLVFGGGNFQLVSSSPEAFFSQAFSNPAVWVPLVLGCLGLLILFLTLLFWLSARLSIAQVPLSIESDIKGVQTIGRSWNLTKRNAWRIMSVLFITSLITLPLQIVVRIIMAVLQAAMSLAVPSDGSFSGASLLAVLITYLVSFTVSILIVPLWQSVFAAIYYDLRSRREGLGLELRE